MNRRLIAAMAVWCVASCLAQTATADNIATGPNHPAWIKVDVANIRSGPGLNHESYGTRKKGTKVTVVGRRGEWIKVKTPGGFGWIHWELLTDHIPTGQKLAAAAGIPTAGGGDDRAWIKADNARVRAKPSLDAKIYGTRPIGTEVQVLGRQGDWARVKTPGGVGWIHTDLLTDHAPTGQRLADSGSSGTPDAKKAFASGDNLYLRAGPGVSHDYRGVLKRGQTLYVTEVKGDWCRVHVKAGNWGWVYGGYVTYADGGSPSGAQASNTTGVANFPSPTRQYTGAVALQETNAWVDENQARVRYGPGLDHDVKATLARHTQVAVTDLDGHWCKVKLPDGSYGWMAGWILDFDGPGQDIMAQEAGQSVEVKVGWVARPTVNLRDGPSTNNNIIGQATLSTQVVILEQTDDWYRVGLHGGKEAWISGRYVDTREQRQVRAEHAGSMAGGAGSYPSGGSGAGSNMARYAMNYLGRPYVRGGTGKNGSFDCSGFVCYVHSQNGVRLNRTSSAQFRQGTPISRSELQPGDSVFFSNTYKAGISHVGIYIGNGKFIHAANARRGVVINSLDDDYYGPKYAGAKRMW